jgi:hypothetical protein
MVAPLSVKATVPAGTPVTPNAYSTVAVYVIDCPVTALVMDCGDVTVTFVTVGITTTVTEFEVEPMKLGSPTQLALKTRLPEVAK